MSPQHVALEITEIHPMGPLVPQQQVSVLGDEAPLVFAAAGIWDLDPALGHVGGVVEGFVSRIAGEEDVQPVACAMVEERGGGALDEDGLDVELKGAAEGGPECERGRRARGGQASGEGDGEDAQGREEALQA